ncbi:uncharacterized protein VTP21DRAFT_2244 [Calcarisporiella thermophila]|uniref:uncharacterized protein n=1 Tax=Calcarisporiella thermophila TaxID=911321 RepID=UPI003744718D
MKKVLLLGRSGAGKSSMRSIIFSNHAAQDSVRLLPTMDVEYTNFQFLENLMVNLWDCGGQDNFMHDHIFNHREHIFSNVTLLVYVFDVVITGHRIDRDEFYFRLCIEALAEYSSEAKVYCLMHKMDLIPDEMREELVHKRTRRLAALSSPFDPIVHATTIWNESLHAAWSKIVHALIPRIDSLVPHLERFCELVGADEVVLFERKTFLEIASVVRRAHPDGNRLVKISGIVKHFRLNCANRLGTTFESLMIRRNPYSLYVCNLTQHSYVMVVLSDRAVLPGGMELHLAVARKYFEKLEIFSSPYS